MARTLAGRRLTEQHRLAQVRLGILTVAEMAQLWRLLDPTALTDTTPGWIDAAIRLITARHAASAELARRYYQAFRTAELGAPLAGTIAPPSFIDDAVRASLAVTGPVRIERARRRAESIEQAASVARTETARAAQRHALNGGRDLIVQTSSRDTRSGGWARVTSGNACNFCNMLASRGAVYGEQSVDFQSHDGCSCTGEPAWR